jgi:uncharacterized protein YdaU (DUF1376 family)
MNEHPYMPLFFGDVLKQTVFWQGEERALLLVLMAVQWSTGALPLNLQKLSNAVQYPLETFTRLWHAHVHEQFAETADGYVNAELERHREHLEHLSAVRAAAGRASGKARRAKARTGRREQTREHVFKQNTEQVLRTQDGAFVRTPSHPNPEPLSSDSGSSADLASPPVQPSVAGADPPPAAAAPQRAPGKRKSMPPEHDTEKFREWSRTNAPLADFDAEIAMIRDHEFRDAHSDWDAVLRNWLRRAHRDKRNAGRPPPGPERITRFEQHKRRLFREEQG